MKEFNQLDWTTPTGGRFMIDGNVLPLIFRIKGDEI